MYILRLKDINNKWQYLIDIGFLGLPHLSENINQAIKVNFVEEAKILQEMTPIQFEILEV